MSSPARPIAAASAVAALTLTALALPTTAYADTLVPSTFKVNFQAPTSTAPSGYTGDAGQPYSATRGYGWTTSGGTPLDLTANGMGVRSQRYSMLVVDGVVKTLNVEAPGKFEVSDADTMLQQAKKAFA